MVHEGFQRYDNVEIVNTERLSAYVRNGIKPTNLTIDVPAVCEGLSDIITSDGPYRTPLQDQAPWVDLNDSDTWDFAGLLPLELTGTDDTTRTVTMTPTVRDGALPGSARRGPRTVGATALLVGRTSAGVHAGLAWLDRALHGACADVDSDCGPAATLELFTSAPGIGVTANTALPPQITRQQHPSDPQFPSYDWAATGGTFNDGTDDYTSLRPYNDAEVYDGAGPTTDVPTVADAGGPSNNYPVADGGNAVIFVRDVVLTGATYACTDGPVTIRWELAAQSEAATTVQLVTINDAGDPIDFGPKIDLPTETEVYEWELPFGVSADTWRPGIITSQIVAVTSVEVSRYYDVTPMECVAPYQRFMPNTVTTIGPTVVEQINGGDGVELLKVEWTWVGSPYRYGVTSTVLAGLSADTDATLALPGVSWDRSSADPEPSMVDNCSTLQPAGPDSPTGWTISSGSSISANGQGQIVASNGFRAAQIRRTGVIDVATRRYIAINWSNSSTESYTPGLYVMDTRGVAASMVPVLTTAASNGRTRSVFALPDSIGETLQFFEWAQADGDTPFVTVTFDSVETQTVAAPAASTISAAPWNCLPPAPALSCAIDPTAPGFSQPPALPYVAATRTATITDQQVRDYWACVGPEQTPANDGVLTIELAASNKPIVGARVRVWDTTVGDCTVPDLCDFAYEYLIDFIPANGVFTIDGVNGVFTTLCDGGAVLADASGVVRGDFGGPTKTPVARCDRRYLVRVQWLATYPRSAPPLYTSGQDQGNLTLTLGVTPREG